MKTYKIIYIGGSKVAVAPSGTPLPSPLSLDRQDAQLPSASTDTFIKFYFIKDINLDEDKINISILNININNFNDEINKRDDTNIFKMLLNQDYSKLIKNEHYFIDDDTIKFSDVFAELLCYNNKRYHNGCKFYKWEYNKLNVQNEVQNEAQIDYLNNVYNYDMHYKSILTLDYNYEYIFFILQYYKLIINLLNTQKIEFFNYLNSCTKLFNNLLSHYSYLSYEITTSIYSKYIEFFKMIYKNDIYGTLEIYQPIQYNIIQNIDYDDDIFFTQDYYDNILNFLQHYSDPFLLEIYNYLLTNYAYFMTKHLNEIITFYDKKNYLDYIATYENEKKKFIQELLQILMDKQWRYQSLFNTNVNITYNTFNTNNIITNIYKKFINSFKNIKLYQISFEDGGNNMSNLKNLIWHLELLPNKKIIHELEYNTTFINNEHKILNLLEISININDMNIVINNDNNNWINKLDISVNHILELSFIKNTILYNLNISVEKINSSSSGIASIEGIIKNQHNLNNETIIVNTAIINLTNKFFTHKVLGRTLFITNFKNKMINKVYCYKIKKTSEKLKELEYENLMLQKFGNDLSNIIDYVENKSLLVNSTNKIRIQNKTKPNKWYEDYMPNQIKQWIHNDWFYEKLNYNKGYEDFEIDKDIYLYYEIKSSQKHEINAINFTQYLEEETDIQQHGTYENYFIKGSKICLEQIALLLKSEYYHSSLINLFHNKADGRQYSFLADYMVSQIGRYGYGKLSRFYKIGKFSNMRRIGFADFAEIKLKITMLNKLNEINPTFNNSPNQNAVLELELLLNNYFSWILILINRRMLLNYKYEYSKEQIDMIWDRDLQSENKDNPSLYNCEDANSCLGSIFKWGLQIILSNYCEKYQDIENKLNDLSIIDFNLAAKQIDYFTSIEYVNDTVSGNFKYEIYPNTDVNIPKIMEILSHKDDKYAYGFINDINDQTSDYDKIILLNRFIPRGWLKVFILDNHNKPKYEINMGWMSSLISIYENNNIIIQNIFQSSDFVYHNFIGDSENGGILLFLKENQDQDHVDRVQEYQLKLWKLLFEYIDGGAANGSFPFFELLKGAHIIFFHAIYSNYSVTNKDVLGYIGTPTQILNLENDIVPIHLMHTLLDNNDNKIYIKNYILLHINDGNIKGTSENIYTALVNNSDVTQFFDKYIDGVGKNYQLLLLIKNYNLFDLNEDDNYKIKLNEFELFNLHFNILKDMNISIINKNLNYENVFNRYEIILNFLIDTHFYYTFANLVNEFLNDTSSIENDDIYGPIGNYIKQNYDVNILETYKDKISYDKKLKILADLAKNADNLDNKIDNLERLKKINILKMNMLKEQVKRNNETIENISTLINVLGTSDFWEGEAITSTVERYYINEIYLAFNRSKDKYNNIFDLIKHIENYLNIIKGENYGNKLIIKKLNQIQTLFTSDSTNYLFGLKPHCVYILAKLCQNVDTNMPYIMYDTKNGITILFSEIYIKYYKKIY